MNQKEYYAKNKDVLNAKRRDRSKPMSKRGKK